MSYCINPYCFQRQNPDSDKFCQVCGTQLLIHNRYRLVKPLRKLSNAYHTEIFEVEDRETPKVLKILKTDEDALKLVELFEQEAKILRYLKHPGIPKAELDGYFTFLLSNGEMLRCLVMEQIAGQDLHQWLEQHGPISETQALGYLRQLIEILAQVHQNEFFHRDIKPSNIMLKPDGQLVLIDFGTARRVTQTVIKGQNVTVVYSHGYTAPEQFEGKAVPQSDFYAVGRTMVRLLTGKQPDELKETETGQLLWRTQAPQISKPLADLLDHLMARSPKARPQNAEVILQRLDKIERDIFTDGKQGKSKNKWLVPIITGGVAVVGIIGGVVIFDTLLKGSRPREPECFTDVPNIPQGTFYDGGSTTWAPIRKLVDQTIKETRQEFHLRYEHPSRDEGTASSSTGIQMLLNTRLDIAQSSRPLFNSENQQAQQRGFSLIQVPVAIDGIAVAVNHQLNIPGLTVAQLKDIYLGKIRNWQQVGGPNLAITPYSRQEDGGTVEWFIDNILQSQFFGNNVKFVPNTTEGIKQVANAPGGIYYASAPEVVSQCTIRPLPLGLQPGQYIPPYQQPLSTSCATKNRVNRQVITSGDYPLIRNLYVIFKDYSGDDNPQEKAGRAYANLILTPQGQKLIEQAGFVAIRPSNGSCSTP